MQARELFSKQEELSSENEGLRARARLDEEKIKFLQSEVTWLHEQIRSLKRAQFGRKSECWVSPEQGVLYNEVELEVSKGTSEEDETQVEVTVPAHKRKRGHRRPIPENLEREVVKIELPENEQFTEEGDPSQGDWLGGFREAQI
ncbi:MAG: transposase [Bdellovibrionales bacterium]|nr:transposase [Bdellovibrionales bacterium]